MSISTTGMNGPRKPFLFRCHRHEFVGKIAAIGSNVHDFAVGEIVSGEGHVVCGRCRNCLAGRRHLCNKTSGVGCQPARRLCRIPVDSGHKCLAAIPTFPSISSLLRSAWQCSPLALAFKSWRRCPDHWRRTDRHHGGSRGQACWCPVCGHFGCQSLPAGTGQKNGATLTVDVRSESIRDAMVKLDMKEGFDVGLEMSGNGQASAP